MPVKSARILNFRNIEDAQIELADGINVFVGDNGEGKTNLLEAIYYLGNLKCFRTSRTGDCVRWGEASFHVSGETYDRDRFEVTYSREEGKNIRLNGKRASSLDYLRRITVLGFFPQEEVRTFSSPHNLRSLLDRGVFYVDKLYLSIFREFRKLLNDRNALLREGERVDEKLLSAVTENFMVKAREIDRRRREFVTLINPYLQEISGLISGMEWNVKLEYRESAYDGIGSREELEAGYTVAGPHRGRVIFRINGINLRDFGSQGQIKTTLLAFKLAIVKILSERGEDPLFVIDDIGGELDEKRRVSLFDFLRELGVQSMLTTAIDLGIEGVNNFRVEKGKIWN